jgi:hypothetical protein
MVNILYLGACDDSNPKTWDYELSALQLCYRGTLNRMANFLYQGACEDSNPQT